MRWWLLQRRDKDGFLWCCLACGATSTTPDATCDWGCDDSWLPDSEQVKQLQKLLIANDATIPDVSLPWLQK